MVTAPSEVMAPAAAKVAAAAPFTVTVPLLPACGGDRGVDCQVRSVRLTPEAPLVLRAPPIVVVPRACRLGK
jgi:hypothetical protein